MLARYCLLALAALTVLVDAGNTRGRSIGRSSRGRNINIRNTNRASDKYSRSNTRASITPRKSTVNKKNSKKISSKRIQASNKQILKFQQNEKHSHTNNNSGALGNNFFKSHVGKTTNDNRIRATRYAKVDDNDQESTQKVRSGHIGITGNLQPYNGFFGGSGLTSLGSGGASPFGASDLSSLNTMGAPTIAGAPNFANIQSAVDTETAAPAAPAAAPEDAAPAAATEPTEDAPTEDAPTEDAPTEDATDAEAQGE